MAALVGSTIAPTCLPHFTKGRRESNIKSYYDQAALIWKSIKKDEKKRDKRGTMAVPEMMLGSFQMETSEGFDEFMYELGVNMFTRLVIGREDQNAYVWICWVF